MRPTGRLHLGNYHGALRNWVELQYQYECFFMVADWHMLTTGYDDTSQLQEHVRDVLIAWLGGGLKARATYGFLGYPLLQSADILVYRAAYVPVGEDQVAHVELTRETARRFNHLYGREPGFEEKAERAVKSLGGRNTTSYRQLRRRYQETGDSEALER